MGLQLFLELSSDLLCIPPHAESALFLGTLPCPNLANFQTYLRFYGWISFILIGNKVMHKCLNELEYRHINDKSRMRVSARSDYGLRS